MKLDENKLISLKDAIDKGLTKYFTGKPCKNGHVSERYVKRGRCVECDKKVSSEWKKNHPESNRKKAKRWRDNNPEKTKEINYKSYLKCLKDNTEYKLAHNLRRRLYAAIRKNYKTGSAVRDMGCSVEEFKLYLENKFEIGMSWENYGKEWQIDHIIPLAIFNLNDRCELLKPCHFTNMQPLFKKDHLHKTVNERINKIY